MAQVLTAADVAGPPLAADARNPGIDALRVLTTFLVVLHHTAITYGAIGGWYYHELAPSRSLSSQFLVFFCALNQAWFMGFFFLLAGYYTPPALDRKGTILFVRDRLIRLGVPLLLYVALIGPATIALAKIPEGRPIIDTLLRLWRRGVIEVGPLWFAWALLIFSAFALLWRAWAGSRPRHAAAFPDAGVLLLGALATGTIAFALRLVWPVGTTVLALQLGYFASYAFLFAFGCAAAAGRWLENVPADAARLWRRVAYVALPVLPLVELSGLGGGDARGGLSLKALDYAFWEPFVAWGTILTLLQLAQGRWQATNELWRTAGRRAFAIFVIHPPVVVAVSLAMRGVPAPALVKFAVTGAVSCVLCYLLAGALLRVPLIARVL